MSVQTTCRVEVTADGTCRVQLRGNVTLDHVMVLRSQLPLLDDGARVELDFEGLEQVDGAGAAVLRHFIDAVESGGGRVVMVGTPRVQQMVELYRRRGDDPLAEGGSAGFLAAVGGGVAGCLAGLPRIATSLGMYLSACGLALRRPGSVNWREVPELVQRAGANGVLIVLTTNLLIGAIIGFQGVVQLRNFGADALVPEMVALGHLRELGPIMTAIIVAGRSGAGFAAELGTMKVSEEVDALRTMGFDPLRWLVFPRLIALLISLPLLTLMGDVVGIAGGALASLPLMEINLWTYIEKSLEAAQPRHTFYGIGKAFAFAVAIGVLACSQGLAAKGGASAVGVRTTAAVVLAIFSVILLDAGFAFASTIFGF